MIGDTENVGGFSKRLTVAVVEEAVDSRAGYADGPERNLLAALLFDGIQSYVNYLLAKTEADRSRFREAYRWVQSRESDYTFSFVRVCEALGICPEYLRLGIINATKPQLRLIAQSRRIW